MPAENAVISIRVPVVEYEAVQRAAQAVGESMASYVREAIAQRLQGVMSGDLREHIASGTTYTKTLKETGIGTTWTAAAPVFTLSMRVQRRI
jgi:hypothetical protein